MKEDYLWDKTGEPDPEVQQLEQLLGTLRYQPRPLDIPAGVTPELKRTFPSRLPAIAATIAIMLLGGGLWFGLQKTQTGDVAGIGSKPAATGNSPEAVAPVLPPVLPKVAFTPTPVVPSVPDQKQIRHRSNPGALSREAVAGRRPKLTAPELSTSEREEAEAVKEQLMLALRVASSKLSFAQKKAQEINSENLTRNQHKVG